MHRVNRGNPKTCWKDSKIACISLIQKIDLIKD